MMYVVEFRYWDNIEQDAWILRKTVEASSVHEAIGRAWPLMKNDVEGYGGTIDDLDGWEAEEKPSRQEEIAFLLFVYMTGGNKENWKILPTNERKPYHDGAQAIIDGKIA